MEHVPITLGIAFAVIALLAVAIFYRAARHSRATLAVLVAWLGLQALVALSGFFAVTNTVPPRALGLVAPPVLLILLLLGTPRGRHYLDRLDLRALTLLHLVRIPVELVLYGLFVHKAVPELMTFSGRNWDILSGLSAPAIYYLVFQKKILGLNWLLAWNFVCLGLLFNIVGTALLSTPSIFQQFAFEQPNVAILHFPFNWLPSVVVPTVLLAHLAAIRQLLAIGGRISPAPERHRSNF
ncbi:hypothetical protein MUN81_10600 [Hymenobacter sp. 5317J-9]|uniref:hypothetical protein n=1 Tax=Hymenobacter sp. 5317J-9 TaxID=2932250 RepID=UPI001FD6557A|nr:hypothetical protein [Hymenobacter sp. 5317J-9]UOQ99928.1 hypothetical protein MUN81_10600 [Hymenobacter sp. 5317J-9]